MDFGMYLMQRRLSTLAQKQTENFKQNQIQQNALRRRTNRNNLLMNRRNIQEEDLQDSFTDKTPGKKSTGFLALLNIYLTKQIRLLS